MFAITATKLFARRSATTLLPRHAAALHSSPTTSRVPEIGGCNPGSHMTDEAGTGIDEALSSQGDHWVEGAASVSEAAVKADHSPDESIEELQHETVEKLTHV
ncbi:hypothetical protein H9P43_008096 [Blastocladiella emersonii ATCC 22665]|nr:hypothetical protein H9P43_008096 [Blastocladiella emersonii ATCC 22665]